MRRRNILTGGVVFTLLVGTVGCTVTQTPPVQSHKKKIETLDKRVTTLERDIWELQKEVENTREKVVLETEEQVVNQEEQTAKEEMEELLREINEHLFRVEEEGEIIDLNKLKVEFTDVFTGDKVTEENFVLEDNMMYRYSNYEYNPEATADAKYVSQTVTIYPKTHEGKFESHTSDVRYDGEYSYSRVQQDFERETEGVTYIVRVELEGYIGRKDVTEKLDTIIKDIKLSQKDA